MIAGMNGPQIRYERERRGWSQPELAKLVGVGSKTIGNWENDRTEPKNKLGKLQAVFAAHSVTERTDDPLRAVSDAELLAEMARRMSDRQQRTG